MPTPLLAEILGTSVERIRSRDELEHWRKPGRRVERVVWASDHEPGVQAACVKYGTGLEREALAYTALLDAALDRVPRLIGHRPLGADRRVVAIEWLDGRTPDFWKADDLLPVFTGAGRFAAEWAARVQTSSPGGRGLARNPVPPSLQGTWQSLLAGVRGENWYEAQFTNYTASALDREELLGQVGGAEAVDACRRVGTLARRLASVICSVPLTLDPGDFADENALLAPDGTVYLLDFDNVRLAPVVAMLDSVGEEWSSQPAPALVDQALRAFVNAWDAVAGVGLDWHRFRSAHHSLRVWRKCFEVEYSLRDAADNGEQGPGEYADGGPVEFARECARQLPALLDTAVAALYPRRQCRTPT